MTIIKNIHKLLKKNNSDDMKVIYQNSTSKYSMTADCTMEISSYTQQKKEEINKTLKQLLKKYIDNPEKLIQYLILKGIKIYRIENSAKFLSYLDEEEGFISPLSGLKAFLLSSILSILTEKKLKISFKTREMLIFNSKNPDIYIIARALHKYYGYKNNLPGFDYKSQELFKKLYSNRNSKKSDEIFEKLKLKDLYGSREALARDLDSINFTIQLSLEHDNSKKILKKIITEKNAKI